jgi:hypothetical protein
MAGVVALVARSTSSPGHEVEEEKRKRKRKKLVPRLLCWPLTCQMVRKSTGPRGHPQGNSSAKIHHSTNLAHLLSYRAGTTTK